MKTVIFPPPTLLFHPPTFSIFNMLPPPPAYSSPPRLAFLEILPGPPAYSRPESSVRKDQHTLQLRLKHLEGIKLCIKRS